jgi:hypothetical protein
MPGGSVRRKTPHLVIISSQPFSKKGARKGDLRRLLTRRTNNRNTLRHHNLIPTMRMQIPTTHKTRLGRMGMDPA